MEHLTPAQLQALLGAPETKQLMAMLQKNSGTALQQAAAAAKRGDTAQVQALLKQSLTGSEAETLAKALEQRLG